MGFNRRQNKEKMHKSQNQLDNIVVDQRFGREIGNQEDCDQSEQSENSSPELKRVNTKVNKSRIGLDMMNSSAFDGRSVAGFEVG